MSHADDAPVAADVKFVRVCSKRDIPASSGKAFKVGTLELAVFHSAGKYYATRNICTHEREHLHEGWLDGDALECPRHGAQFNLQTGAALSLPATQPLEVFRIVFDGDELLVGIPTRYL